MMGKAKLEAGVRDVDLPGVREYQRPVYESAARFKLVICGRRWGKSKVALLCAVNGHGPAVDGDGERRHFRGALRGGRIGWFVPSWEHVSGQEAWADLKAALGRAQVREAPAESDTVATRAELEVDAVLDRALAAVG